MPDKPMMKCGHAANAHRGKSAEPCCAICAPDAEAYEVATTPDLSQRTMICVGCRAGGGPRPSSVNAAFFSHRPDRPHDEYYCGCYGWD